MRLAKTMVAAVLVPTVAGLVWWAASSTSKGEPGAAGSPRAESVAPGSAQKSSGDGSQKEAMQRLEARLKLLEMQAQHPAPTGGAAPVAERNDTPGASPTPAVDPRVTANNEARTYDDILRVESVDREWNAAMQTRVQEFFRSDKAVGSSVQRIECRSTMCRVEVASQSKEARDAFTQTMSSMSPPHAQGFAHIDTDESLQFVVYFTREDQALPAPAM